MGLVIGDKLAVRGVGRVGSYESAKKAHRSRPRRYWAVMKWSDSCSPQCREVRGMHIHVATGWRELPDSPSFKTRTAAVEYLNILRHDNPGIIVVD